MNQSFFSRRVVGAFALLSTACTLAAQQPAFPNQFSTHFRDSWAAPSSWAFNAQLPTSSVLNARDVLLRDFDGDGDIDVYVVDGGSDSYYANGNPTQIFANPLGRFFDRSSRIQRPANGATSGAAGDLDNDGDIDVVLAITQSFGNGNVLFFRNNPAGPFRFDDSATVTHPPTLIGNARSIALVDWNGDGLLDIFVGTGPSGGFPGGLVLYLNSPASPGTFVGAAVPVPAVASPAIVSSLAVGDINGDGNPDLYCGLRAGSDGPGAQALILNTTGAPGGFIGATAAAGLGGQPLRRSSAATLVDVDLDGDLDLITANESTLVLPGGTRINGQEELYLNIGGAGVAAFAAPTLLPGSLDSTTDLQAADLDGDGFIELVTSNDDVLPGSDGQTRYYDFDPATNAFVDASARIENDADVVSSGLALADMDFDGDLDLFLANPNEDSLRYLPNASRHIDAPRAVDAASGATTYRVTVGFDVGFKNPGTDVLGTILLSIPPTVARVPVPGFGLIVNDPQSISFSPFVLAPGTDTTEILLNIAQGTSIDFVLQGIMLITPPTGPATFDVTNVLRTTI